MLVASITVWFSPSKAALSEEIFLTIITTPKIIKEIIIIAAIILIIFMKVFIRSSFLEDDFYPRLNSKRPEGYIKKTAANTVCKRNSDSR